MKPSQEWMDKMSNLAGRMFGMMRPGQTVTFLIHDQPNIIVPNMEQKPPQELIITRAHPDLSGSIHVKMVMQQPKGGNGGDKKT